MPRLPAPCITRVACTADIGQRQIADCQRRVNELGKEQTTTKSDKGRVSSLEKSIASMEKEVSKLRAETVGVETEIKGLQDKIMEVGGVKLRSQKAKVDGLKQQIDTLTDQCSNAEVSKSKEEKQRAKHEKAHDDAAKELLKTDLDSLSNRKEIVKCEKSERQFVAVTADALP